jgi:hypothetical protein
MIWLLCFVLAVSAAPIKSKLRLEAENAVLRHQLRERLNRECASVEPGQGRLESCLRSAAAKLDDYCKGALSRAIPGAGNVR